MSAAPPNPNRRRRAKRLLHWLLNAMTLLSLLLCLASAGLWVRSYGMADFWFRGFYASTDAVDQTFIGISNGWVFAEKSLTFGPNAPPGSRWRRPPNPQWVHPQWWHYVGATRMWDFRSSDEGYLFSWEGPQPVPLPPPAAENTSVTIPRGSLHVRLMGVTSLTSLLPGWWTVRRLLSRHGHKRGCCRVCGYDLRATPERCPECGTIVEHPKEAVAST